MLVGKTKTRSRASARIQSLVLCGLTIALMTVSAWITIPIGFVPVTLQTFVMIFALLYLTPRQYLVSIVTYILIGAVGLPVFSGMRGGIGILLSYTGGFLWGFILGALAAFLVMFLLDKLGSSSRTKTSNRASQTNTTPEVMASTRHAFDSIPISSQQNLADYQESSITNRDERSSSPSKIKQWLLRFGRDILVASVFLAVMYVCGWLQFILVTGLDPLAAFLASVAPFIIIDIAKMIAAVFMVATVKQALGLRRKGKEALN